MRNKVKLLRISSAKKLAVRGKARSLKKNYSLMSFEISNEKKFLLL